MTKIEELATVQELQELGWMTISQAKEERGVSTYTAYRWGPALQEKGLARKLPLPGRGLWILSPEAIEFLVARRGRIGRPVESEDREDTEGEIEKSSDDSAEPDSGVAPGV